MIVEDGRRVNVIADDNSSPAPFGDAFLAYKARGMVAMRLQDGSRVADVGCGRGDDAVYLARIVGPRGKVVGVDIGQALVSAAAERSDRAANLDFVFAAADRLPFGDGALDAIRADRLLVHLADPAAAIGEMVRALRPGGRIVLSEPDMVGFWISSGDREVSAAVSRAIADACRHPFLPRDMGVMLRDMGLGEVEHWAEATISTDFIAVDRLARLEFVVNGLKAADAFPRARLDDWWNDQLERNVASRFCAGLDVMTVAATRP